MPDPNSNESVQIYGDFYSYDADLEEYLNELEDQERAEEEERLLIALEQHETQEEYYRGCGGGW